MRTKKGGYTIMKTEKQLPERVESLAQDQEPNALADQELEVISGGSVRKSARDGAIGGAVIGAGAGAATGLIAAKKYNKMHQVLESGKRVSGKGKIGAAIGGAALGAGAVSAAGATLGAIGGAISKG
jgi:hypothetical protein